MPGSIRLFVTSPLQAGAELLLERRQTHYLAHVMRRRAGDEVVVFNGRNGEWQARIVTLAPDGGGLAVEQRLRPQVDEPDLWLAFAILKRAATEMLVQKATELGVARLLPVVTEHTVASTGNRERLLAIATEASEQCGRLNRPMIAEPTSLPALLERWPEDRPLFAAVTKRGPPPPPPMRSAAGLLVGPEGDFAEGELDLLALSPFVRPVSLGPRILRAETAAIVGLALLAVPAERAE